MNAKEHEQIESLLGAFVLNALDPLEYRRVSKHLSSCTGCANEVALLQGPAAELAMLPGPESDADELVDRITAALPWRPTRVMTRLTAGIAAVAIAIAGFLGVSLMQERNDRRELTDILAVAERIVELRAEPGFDGEGKLYLAGDRAALVLERIPDPGRGKSYQLWSVAGTKPTSMTVVGGGERVVDLLEWNGRADVFAVTIEPAGGSPVPTTDPVLQGA